MGRYLVTLRAIKDDMDERYCSCKDEKELSNLLLHMDKNRFRITNIFFDGVKIEDYKEFCKQDNNLEIGKN